MCESKGLHLLIEAFIELKNRNNYQNLKLKVGGTCLPEDEEYVNLLKQKLKYAGYLEEVEFYPNITKKQKIEFYKSIDLFCIPAIYGEAFGLPVVEAMAAGVPLVLPRHGSFIELVEETGTGVLYAPNFIEPLTNSLNYMLANREFYSKCRNACIQAARERFDHIIMAKNFINAIESITRK